jgi:hypothetical protein
MYQPSPPGGQRRPASSAFFKPHGLTQALPRHS